MTSLHFLDRRDVQRICSGQSVVDLATAVKELVENALDAGATQIEVKLIEMGRDSIEVSDNGAGVARENYGTLAQKHCTSKISHFEDIASVTSFGFRGEALSSICALAASFKICTRTQSDAVGALLEYDALGNLMKETKKARPVGTTVAVEGLFKPLAVRSKDFQRNIKKHYTKLLKVLQGYAVSCVNVKLSVFNSSKNVSRQVVLATQAQQTMGENIASVFGTKFFRTLLSVDVSLHEEFENRANDTTDEARDEESEELERKSADNALSQRQWNVVGYVSKVGAGVGRSDSDRQFFFINGRPFDLPKVAKTLNEVWRQYEMKHKPACVLDFHLPVGDYDVNVTPDKRETFLKHEAEIVDAFKCSLTRLYEPSRGTFTVQPVMSTFPPASTSNKATNQPASPFQHDDVVQQLQHELLVDNCMDHDRTKVSNGERVAVATPSPELVKGGVLHRKFHWDKTNERSPKKGLNEPKQDSSPNTDTASPLLSPIARVPDVRASAKRQKQVNELSSLGSNDHVWSFDEIIRQRQQFFEEEVEYERRRKVHRLKVPKACSALLNGNAVEAKNDVAAAALQRVLKKDDFNRMTILGQFNLGFIIAKLDNDMYIIDQHASDEKHKYEVLQRTTVMHQQPLVRPLVLELTAGEEMTILDHLDVFAKNGFTFYVDHDAPATKKLKLLSLPFTKHTQFGTEDIRELASLLMDAPVSSSTIHLPKVMAMFASRACRSSTMIGTALHKEEMQKIVRNLADLDQPWNCPHGRPTLRHLVDLLHLNEQDPRRLCQPASTPL